MSKKEGNIVPVLLLLGVGYLFIKNRQPPAVSTIAPATGIPVAASQNNAGNILQQGVNAVTSLLNTFVPKPIMVSPTNNQQLQVVDPSVTDTVDYSTPEDTSGWFSDGGQDDTHSVALYG